MKKAFKRMIMFALSGIMSFAFIACDASKRPSRPSDPADLPALAAPVASIDVYDGTVTWTEVVGAAGYAYRVDGGAAVNVEAGAKSITLEAGQSAQIKALGNGTTNTDSEWSNTVDYVFSYLLNNVGETTSGINIYTVDGESVLDTFFGSKPHGDLLKTDTDYIFQFDATMGSYPSGLLFTGVENAVISDVVWSDSPYEYRDGEEAEPDILKEVLYKDMSAYYPSYHRVDWAAGYWGIETYGWNYGPDAKNVDGVYDTSAQDFWTVPANECGTFFEKHWLATEKSTNLMPGKEFLRFKINFKSFDKIWTPNYNGLLTDGKAIDSLSGRTGFNFFATLRSAHYYLFGDGYVEPKIAGATESYAKNEVGEKTGGINIYDKESGELVLNAMDAANSGNVLESDKEYVFEFKVNNNVATPLLMAGLARAVVTDIFWTDSLYGASEQDEAAISDDVYLANHAVSTGDNQKLFHTLTWDSVNNRYTAGLGVKRTGTVHEYQWSSGGKCTSLNGMYIYVTGKRTDETNKNYFRMTVKFVSDESKTFARKGFMHIGAGAVITDHDSENYGNWSAKDFNLFLYYGAGSYSVYLADALTPFEPFVPDPDATESVG